MKKRSIRIHGHATSISLEDEFWAALKQIAMREQKALNDLIAEIDARKAGSNLSSALRIYVLNAAGRMNSNGN